MRTLQAPDAISGKEGRAYANIGGSNEELFYAKAIEATIEYAKGEVKCVGKRMVGHKTTGASGSGSMTLYYLSPIFRKFAKSYIDDGRTLYFNMVIENADPDSKAGTQRVMLRSCSLDSVVLAQLDGDSDDPLEEEIPFTFDDFEILDSFRKF